MKNVKFNPWVGTAYQKGINGKRVMVLGESHYCADPADATPNMTTDIISDLFDDESEHEGYKNTYTKFIRALVGRDISTVAEKRAAWNSVLFYNYVQTPISGARVRPTTAEFNASADAFFEVLEQYRPDVVLVWGYDLYNNLPRKGAQGADAEGAETWIYELSNGKRVELLRMLHPSAGYSPSEWHKPIMDIVNR